MHEINTEEEEMKQQQKDEDHARCDKEDQSKRQNGRGGSVNCWLPIAKRRGSTRMGGCDAAVVKLAALSEEEG